MKIKHKLIKLPFFLSIFLLFNLATIEVSAKLIPQSANNGLVDAYRRYKDINNLSIAVPTVIEVPFEDEFIERFGFAVLDKTTNSFEPYFFRQETVVNQIPISVNASTTFGVAQRMLDNNLRTWAEFALPENAQGQTQIVLTSSDPITSSSLTILLDNHVALPNSIEIRANTEIGDRIVVATKKLNQETIRFPQTTANRWTITLTYGQPLRITELRLIQENATKTSARILRFLAQPTHTYRIYFDPDRQVDPPVGEAGNLAIDKDVLQIPPVPSQDNPSYTIADVDADGIPDIHDNCVSVTNADQKDLNNNGRGDICDDFDRDGMINSKDNCPNQPNRNQIDTDGDGLGDVCDKEESRITERYAWLPWVGIDFAALVIVILFALTTKSLENKTPPKN